MTAPSHGAAESGHQATSLLSVDDRVSGRVAATGTALFVVLGVLTGGLPPALTIAMTLGGVGLVALVARRHIVGWPQVALLTPVAAIVIAAGHHYSASLGWFAFCGMAALVALDSPLRHALTAWAGLSAVLLIEYLTQTDETGWLPWLTGTTFATVACVGARRQAVLLRRLDAAQAELADRARAEERARIAGEMHDVIGHALTVSALHLSGARLALDEDPEEARASLAEAERQVQSTLSEVRRSVGLMRSADGQREPLPGLADLGALAESFRAAGTTVKLSVAGPVETIGAARELVVYRIVQEALTNVARHGGDSPARVSVRVDGDHVDLRIDNLLVGKSPEPAAGTGLATMRERAHSVGGSLDAGPGDGAWRVAARLPL